MCIFGIFKFKMVKKKYTFLPKIFEKVHFLNIFKKKYWKKYVFLNIFKQKLSKKG